MSRPATQSTDKSEKILVSACLLGKRVRYDGRELTIAEDLIKQWLAAGRVVSVCPEVDAGMAIPRPPAEIASGDGHDVMAGRAAVVASTGVDVTGFFKRGALIALQLCQRHNIRIAVLSEASPSCGSSTIYDGSFTRIKIPGVGVTAAVLADNGVEVFSQYEISAANAALLRLAH